MSGESGTLAEAVPPVNLAVAAARKPYLRPFLANGWALATTLFSRSLATWV